MLGLQFLLLEANLPDAEAVQATLTASGFDYELLRVDTRADFVRALETNAFDLILADYRVSASKNVANHTDNLGR